MSTMQIIEGTPTTWPPAPAGLSTDAAAIDPAVIWRRIETWVAYRWGARSCSFIVEGGCGAWRPPLVPFTVSTVEGWETSDAWSTVDLRLDALGGYVLDHHSHFRFAGSLGSTDEPPEDVLEAYARLAEYSTAKHGLDGSSSRTVELGGDLRESYDRAPTWLARAMTYSGAGDLLRPYRRAP